MLWYFPENYYILYACEGVEYITEAELSYFKHLRKKNKKCKKTIDNFSYKKYNVPRNAIRNFKKVSKRKKGECINYEKAD